MTSATEGTQLRFTAGPPAIVYKTREDYSDKVAVILSEDKKTVVAFPAPEDIAKRMEQVKPALLADGYLLDNQGVNERVAFTSYTFADYAALAQAPTAAEMKASIINEDPLVYMCHCGTRNQYTSIEQAMNSLIKQELAPCKTLLQK